MTAGLSRRRLLTLMGSSGLALGLSPWAVARSRPHRVVVIGAGILGAAIGYELSRRGAQVTLLEKQAPASATTGDSFAYLNASTKAASRPYFDLNWQGMIGWHRWQREFDGHLPLQWNGAVYWRDQPDAAAKLAATLSTVRGWGYPGEVIDADRLRQLLPTATSRAISGGCFYEDEGSVDPVAAVRLLLARAQGMGADVRYPVRVEGFEVSHGRVQGVRTDQGSLKADTVVVAAGLGSQTLAGLLDIPLPLTRSEGVLVHTRPLPPLLDRVAFTPDGSLKQLADGRVIASSGHEGADAEGDRLQQGRRILHHLARHWPALGEATIERVSVGERVLPADSFPVVGFTPQVAQLYLAVSHSGITLAPAIGRHAAQEILDGSRVDALAPFRPDRFTRSD